MPSADSSKNSPSPGSNENQISKSTSSSKSQPEVNPSTIWLPEVHLLGKYTLVERIYPRRERVEAEFDVEVWRATNERGLPKVLKRVRSEGDKFSFEIAAIQLLKELKPHPHIIDIHDYNLTPSELVIETSDMEGSLDDYEGFWNERDKGDTLNLLIKFMLQVANALDHFHAHEFLHFDVKPANILYSAKNAYLADFGSTKSLKSPSSRVPPVTQGFCAPEVGEGRPHVNSDQCGLAYTYLALRTKVPAVESNIKKLSVLTNQSERTVIERAIAVSPIDRYGSCTEFVEQLEKAIFLQDKDSLRAAKAEIQEKFIPSIGGLFNVRPDGLLVLKAGVELRHQGDRYKIEEPMEGRTGQATSYRARDPNGKLYFIKTLRLTHGMSGPDMRERSLKFSAAYHKEAANLEQLGKHITRGVSRVFGSDKLAFLDDRGIRHSLPFIIMEFIDGLPFEEYFRTHFRFDSPDGTGNLVECKEWLRLARELIAILADVHQHGVIHGDLTPDNLMIENHHPVIVDFGESFLLEDFLCEREPGDPLRTHGGLPPERRKRGRGIWSRPADIYAMGNILFWMLAGRDAPDPMLDEGDEGNGSQLKAAVTQELNICKPLLDYNGGIIDAIVGCLQRHVADRFSRAEDILRLLNAFEVADGRTTSSNLPTLATTGQLLMAQLARVQDAQKPFGTLLHNELNLLASKFAGMISSRQVEISGTRNDIVLALLDYLSILVEGEQYLTITTPSFWSPANLGIEGRFLRMNARLAIKGVKIRRIFLVTPDDRKNERIPLREIFAAQKQMLLNLPDGIVKNDASLYGPGVFIGVREVTEEERDTYMQSGYHVGLVCRKEGIVSLSFQEDSMGLIRRLYIWDAKGHATIAAEEDRMRKLLEHPKTKSVLEYEMNRPDSDSSYLSGLR